MKCSVCGGKVYETDNFCEKCGADLKVQPPLAKKNDDLAIVGFVLAFIFPLVGLILSCISFNKIKKEDLAGKEFALAGIIISAVQLGIGLISSLIGLIGSFKYILEIIITLVSIFSQLQ